MHAIFSSSAWVIAIQVAALLLGVWARVTFGRRSSYEGCQVGVNFPAGFFRRGVGRAERSGRGAESRAAALRSPNRLEVPLACDGLASVAFF